MLSRPRGYFLNGQCGCSFFTIDIRGRCELQKAIRQDWQQKRKKSGQTREIVMNTESPFSQCKVHIYECVLYLLCILLFHGSMRLFARIISEIVSLKPGDCMLRSCSKTFPLMPEVSNWKLGKLSSILCRTFFFQL